MNSRSSNRRNARPQPLGGPDSSSPAADRILVGRVGTAHGLRGDVIVEALSDNPRRFVVGSELELRHQVVGAKTLRIQTVRSQGKRLAIRFEGIEDRDAALALRNGFLEVTQPVRAEAPEGQYYYYQLVGCRCQDVSEGFLGVVEEVLEDGGGVLLQVKDGDRELLIPFVDPYLISVDVESQQIDLELPQGLIEICGSK